MAVTSAPDTPTAPPSPAGPLAEDAPALPFAPMLPLSRTQQTLRLGVRQIEYVFRARRELGDVFRFDGLVPYDVTFTCHPDHVKSLMIAPELAPSATGDSPLRPIVGSDSVLTAIGPRHMRQRKLLLPPFHGEAVARYAQLIADAAEREIDRWPVGEPFALAPRMQDVTLEVIMGGIFGIEGTPAPGSDEAGLRRVVRALADASTHPLFQLVELMNVRRTDAVGVLKAAMSMLDRYVYAVIENGRNAPDLEERTDILALLLRARTEDGEPLTDRELRNELVTLILAGHETTANQLAWTFERLVRTPDAYDRLRESVRDGEEDYVEATIHEAMRSRPVVPIIGRRVTV
ncbi:MAG TPA: cytochrome P450, partial [Solirubrobacteraceae bacterium]